MVVVFTENGRLTKLDKTRGRFSYGNSWHIYVFVLGVIRFVTSYNYENT